VPLPDYDRCMLYPAQSVSEGRSPKIGADEVNDEEEGEVWWVHVSADGGADAKLLVSTFGFEESCAGLAIRG
jgi:hypothetical protein